MGRAYPPLRLVFASRRACVKASLRTRVGVPDGSAVNLFILAAGDRIVWGRKGRFFFFKANRMRLMEERLLQGE